MTQQIELGLDTFGDVTRGADGDPVAYPQVIRNVIEEAVLADSVGVDFFGVGEHHRSDFAVSSPEMVLATIAGRTSRIRLGSAVTVLSSDDPIRVFQRFATLDAASSGRAEVILGRGSFTESFPLFGLDLERLRAAVRGEARPVRRGPQGAAHHLAAAPSARPSPNQSVYPTTESGSLKTWIGVGGSPESVVRAARYGMPLLLAIIGGSPERFAPYVDLYHRALTQLEMPDLPVGVHSPGHIADTDEQAAERAVARLQDHARPHRSGARLGSDERDEFDQEIADRLALRRFTRDGGPEDREDGQHSRHRPLRPQIQRGPASARDAHALDRAVRHESHPARAGTSGLTLRLA